MFSIQLFLNLILKYFHVFIFIYFWGNKIASLWANLVYFHIQYYEIRTILYFSPFLCTIWLFSLWWQVAEWWASLSLALEHCFTRDEVKQKTHLGRFWDCVLVSGSKLYIIKPSWFKDYTLNSSERWNCVWTVNQRSIWILFSAIPNLYLFSYSHTVHSLVCSFICSLAHSSTNKHHTVREAISFSPGEACKSSRTTVLKRNYA